MPSQSTDYRADERTRDKGPYGSCGPSERNCDCQTDHHLSQFDHGDLSDIHVSAHAHHLHGLEAVNDDGERSRRDDERKAFVGVDRSFWKCAMAVEYVQSNCGPDTYDPDRNAPQYLNCPGRVQKERVVNVLASNHGLSEANVARQCDDHLYRCADRHDSEHVG